MTYNKYAGTLRAWAIGQINYDTGIAESIQLGPMAGDKIDFMTRVEHNDKDIALLNNLSDKDIIDAFAELYADEYRPHICTGEIFGIMLTLRKIHAEKWNKYHGRYADFVDGGKFAEALINGTYQKMVGGFFEGQEED